MAAPLPTSRKLPPRKPAAPPPRRRVFICDDDLEFAEELASGLVAAGLEVETLAGKKTPDRVFESFAPEFVLLDIYMPPPDGFEILNHVRADPRKDKISLILMSGADTQLLEIAARFCLAHKIHLAGAFKKPLRLAEILRLCQAPRP